MGAIKERLAALGEIAGVRRYVFFTLIAAVLFWADQIQNIVRWGLTQWLGIQSQPEAVGMIFGFPSWIIGVAVAFALLWWWTLEYAVRLRRQLAPKLEASFDPKSGGVSVTNLTNSETGEFVDSVKYVRLAVDSASRKSVQECVANLVKIERRLDLARTETLWDQDALPLVWSVTGGYETKIHYLTKRYIDVARVQKKTGRIEILTIIPNRLAPALKKTGTFLLTIVVTGSGISSDAVIEIETDGTFDGFKARAV